MPNLSLSELDDRARDIFRRVVESYLEHGAPVGSKTLSNDPAINLSRRRRSGRYLLNWSVRAC